MRIRILCLLLLLAIMSGCNGKQYARVTQDNLFLSESKPTLRVEMDGNFKYIDPRNEKISGEGSYFIGRSANIEKEYYYYTQTDDDNKITGAVLVVVNLLKSTNWHWNPIQFGGKNVWRLDNEGDEEIEGFRSVVKLIDDVQPEHLEHVQKMGFKNPEIMLEFTIGKNAGPGNRQQMFISYVESVEQEKYAGIDWSEAAVLDGANRKKALEIFTESYSKVLKVQ